MNNKTIWTEADFDEMTWHDCQINSFALDQEGEWQSDLVLELDFIVEWLCGADKRCCFRIAPALLRFVNVDNLRMNLFLKFKQSVEIYSIEKTELPTIGYRNYHWIIRVQNYSDSRESVIELDATGFTQELIGRVTEVEEQNLTAVQRRECKNGWRPG